MKRNEHPLLEGIPHWIVKGGVTSILVAAMIAAAIGALWLFNYTAPISIPFLLALVLAIIVFPLVRIGDRFKIPRKVSSVIVVFLVILLLWAAVQLTVTGLITEAPKISNQLANSVQTIGNLLDGVLGNVGVTHQQVNEAVTAVTQAIRTTFEPGSGGADTSGLMQTVVSGIGSLRTAVTGVMSGLFSVLICALLLYYLLSDYERIIDWIATHLGIEPELGVGVVEDTTSSMRDYFKGLAIKCAITAIATGLVLLFAGVPLVIPVVLVTFITGFIPYIGALVAIAFAVLITFGTKGLVTALVVFVIILVIQNLLEQIVFNKVVGDSLRIHPIAVLVVTLFGFTVGGLLGGTLAAPLAAMVMRIFTRLNAVREAEDKGMLTEEIRQIKSSGVPLDELRAREQILVDLVE